MTLSNPSLPNGLDFVHTPRTSDNHASQPQFLPQPYIGEYILFIVDSIVHDGTKNGECLITENKLLGRYY